MDTDKHKPINTELLYSDLTYKIRGAIMSVSNKYGKGLKESIYQNALAEEFSKAGLKFEKEKRIPIYSLESANLLGHYTPDFVVEDAIVVEIKATDFTIQKNIDQQFLT